MNTGPVNPRPPELDSLCDGAKAYDASDILLHEGQVPRYRLADRLVEIEHPSLTAEFFDALWSFCGVPGEVVDFDGSITSGKGERFRVNLLRQLGRRAAVMRVIRSEIPALESLGLPEGLLQGWCNRLSGIILVCGPTGSGKSTTLAVALQWINQNLARHVVTIEDPVEYLFRNDQSIFTQREVGVDTASFAEGLRRSLRQDPDVIMVGEIRDALTASTAIQAAETGHLVLATLHSSSCSEAIERLYLLMPPAERENVRKTLANQLVGLLCQRLLPGAQGGVVLAAEYFTNGGITRKYIAEGLLPELADFIARSDGEGTKDFISALVSLAKAGAITEETAMASVERPQELQRALRGISSSAKSTRS